MSIPPYTTGDMFYADTPTTIARLSDAAIGNVLISGGVGVKPSFGKIDLNIFVTGILSPTHGGTGSAYFFVNGLTALRTITFSDQNQTIPTSTGIGATGTWPIDITGTAAGGSPPSGAAGGDLSGTYPNPTVAKINGVLLGSTTATAGNLLIGSGTAWITNSITGDATLSSLGVLTFDTVNSNVGSFGDSSHSSTVTINAKGLVTAASDTLITPAAIGAPTTTGTGATGTWSIDISGNAATVTTNANLTGDVTSVGNATTLASVNSNVGTFGDGTHTSQVTLNAKGQVTAASSVAITGAAPTGAASGDLSGTYPGPTVAKINGVALGSTTATSGNILIGSGTAWVTNAVSGDITLGSTGVTLLGNNVVSYAKFQQVAASSLVGNATGSLANATGITLGSTLTFVSTALQTLAITGDVTASANSFVTTVAKINGATLGSTTASSGNILIGSGSQWVTNAMSGDITIGSTGVTAIGSNKVTLGQMAQMATASFLGRNTASTGNVEVLSEATVKTMLNLSGTNSGDVTLAGENYLSIASQVITANAVNLSGTNATGILAAARFPALTGDVTTSSGAIATTVAANAITYSKFQQVAASSLVGNATGSLANATGITLGSTLTFVSTALQTLAITGDVTASANSFATTLATNVVTYAKFQQVAAVSLVGNPTGSLANASGITLGTSLTFSGSTINTIQGIRTADSPTFTNLTVSATSANAILNITSTTSGECDLIMSSAGQCNIYMKRASTSFQALQILRTGASDEWYTGLNTSSNNYVIRDAVNSVDVLTLVQGSGTSSTATFAGGLNVGGLSTSSLVATDGSKNLTSSTSSLSPIFTGLTVNTIVSNAATVLALSSPAPATNVDAVGITIIASNGTGSGSSAGGPITITSGNGSGASGANGGAISITTGNGSSGGSPGTLTMKAGTSSVTGGITNVQGGAGATSGAGGGQLNLLGGAAPGLGTGGNVVITGGSASIFGTGGDVIITGGAVGTTAIAGNVRIRGGIAASGTQGAVIFDQGNVNITGLTASNIVMTDSSKNLISSSSLTIYAANDSYTYTNCGGL